MNQARPSNYTSHPTDSASQKSETETIARNIMIILKQAGNEFRDLPFEEYVTARMGHGASEREARNEKRYFDKAIPHCLSSDLADKFCRNWFTPSK